MINCAHYFYKRSGVIYLHRFFYFCSANAGCFTNIVRYGLRYGLRLDKSSIIMLRTYKYPRFESLNETSDTTNPETSGQ